MNRAQLDAANDINIQSAGLVDKDRHTAQNNAIAEYATNIIKVTGVAGTTITDSRMAGRDIGLIVINDLTKNHSFTKVTNSSTITFTDGTELGGGETITLLML